MSKGRIEAFSDGVLAVAITLLVLDLHVEHSSTHLWRQVTEEWPSFAAYIISFFVIGVIWVNHHALFHLIARVDRLLLFYNLLLLFWVSTIPFTTSALADFIRNSSTSDTRVAVLLYGASNEGMAISFVLILRHMIARQLLIRPVSADEGRKALARLGLGSVGYPIITVVGLFSASIMFVLYLATIIYYVVEQTPIIAEDQANADSTVNADSTDPSDPD